MGIDCEIKVFTGPDGTVKAGNIVTGVVTYKISEESAINKITVSLKGNGYLIIKQNLRGNRYTHRKHEDYVDIDYIIYKTESSEKIPKGVYVKEFNFILPEDIPPSLRMSKKLSKYLIHCHILYYLRVKFQETGVVNKMTKFKKEFNLISLVKPRLPTEPSTHGEQWVLAQISWKQNIVKIKAMIDKCVRMPGDKINIDYEVVNDTNFVIRGVIVKLIEEYTFKSGATKVNTSEDVINTEERTGIISHGDTPTRSVEIHVPKSARSIDHSNLITREYFVSILLELPKYKNNIVYKIPIQITDDRPPPSYWEVLQESHVSDYQNQVINSNFEDYGIDSSNDNSNVVTTL